MPITSKEIDNVSFSVDRKGYSIEDVDIFLEKVSKSVDVLNKRIAKLEAREDDIKKEASSNANNKIEELNLVIAKQSDKIERLRMEVEKKTNDGKAISEALIVAQRSADKIIQDANDKSAKIIKDANDKADYIEKDADSQKKKVMSEIEKLKKERVSVRKEYQSMLRDIVSAMNKHLSGIQGDVINFPVDNDKSSSYSASVNTTMNTSASNTATNIPIKHANNATPTKNIIQPNPEPSKDFSGFGDVDFDSDQID